MIKFERYPHVNDLLKYYYESLDRPDIASILESGVMTEKDAVIFARFVWAVAGKVNEDEELGNCVLGSSDNTEMLPDLSYEATKYMRKSGYYSIWEKISEEEMQ